MASLTSAAIVRIKQGIANSLHTHAAVTRSRAQRLLPSNIKTLQGKLYEAHVLAHICERLHTQERYNISLVNGTHLRLKQSGGPINRAFPHFAVTDFTGKFIGEIWTDVFFSALSYHERGAPTPISPPDYHELDIAFVKPNASRYPSPQEVLIAVECKNTSLKKSIVREILGFRRELSYYSKTPKSTGFLRWPIRTVNAIPASVHMVFCSDSAINQYAANCLHFGIILEHHNM